MKMSAALPTRRHQFSGMLNIVRFNWPKYAAAIAVMGGALFMLLVVGDDPIVVAVSACAAVAAAGMMCVSLAVSHWVYDRSEIADWSFIPPLLADRPCTWTNVHSGFDETTVHLRRLFPGSQATVIDLFDARAMTERSIHRARRAYPPSRGALAAQPHSLPVASDSQNAVFMLFAAHEVRSLETRRQLFCEAFRVLAPGGRAVLVEHTRDLANGLAFGPGYWHFFPNRQWRWLVEQAGFTLRSESRITPLVRCYVLEKP